MACAQRRGHDSPRLAGAHVAPLRRVRPPPPLPGKAADDAAHCQASSAENGRPQPGVRIQRPGRSPAAPLRRPPPAPPSLSNPQAETRGASPPSRRPPRPLRPAAARPTAAAPPSPRPSPPHEAVVACQPPGRPRVAAAATPNVDDHPRCGARCPRPSPHPQKTQEHSTRARARKRRAAPVRDGAAVVGALKVTHPGGTTRTGWAVAARGPPPSAGGDAFGSGGRAAARPPH